MRLLWSLSGLPGSGGFRVQVHRRGVRKQNGASVSFDNRRIVALSVVLVAVAIFDSRVALILGVVGLVLVVIRASRD